MWTLFTKTQVQGSRLLMAGGWGGCVENVKSPPLGYVSCGTPTTGLSGLVLLDKRGREGLKSDWAKKKKKMEQDCCKSLVRQELSKEERRRVGEKIVR